ncbi:pyrroloquinoline quinone biosynthesis peptide chaperone PqqD [Paraburkholderia sp. RG36]|uniref:PqqA binding protein n=2 Tax=Paraburkholderia tagetis TaxID=2913261 RepID=A0A9X1RIQ6_9BURK|nr:pyrroloquinoline quinone biosynthesis peptide chaperone PqqD [Paraburkholderia tagetis]MCG5071953.1 pyrroloquinoline quinone biosynthesis peptide chaperone PqqD [Paraburkholderia tagetis]
MMSFDRTRIPDWRRGYRFQFEPAQNAHVVLYPEGMVKLNESAAAIGSLINGLRSVVEIIAQLSQQYPGVPELAEDVEQFMEVAHAKHWIEFA